MRARFLRPVLPLALALALAACSGGDTEGSTVGAGQSPTASSSSPSSSSAAASGEPVGTAELDGVVARGLEAPWGLTFLPDGSALVSERDTSRVRLVDTDGSVDTVGEVKGVEGVGEGGLLGIALSPTYEQDRLLFAYYTSGGENVVARITYDNGGLSDQEVVLDGIPAGPIHNGGRIAFGPDGLLYVGTGDSSDGSLSQDRDSLAGKILRVTSEGEPAPDNPDPDSPVYSLGHRNVQGLAFDADGQLWAAEFGQNTWDELNRIQAGGNYGWPEVEGRGGGDEYVDPVRQWRPANASPSGIAIAGQSVFMAALRGQRLWQVPIPQGQAGEPEALLRDDYGRLRTVETAPDGSLWVTTSNRDGRGDPSETDDRILRLTVS